MDWKTRFPVGLFLLAALMLAGGVSAATSMKVAATHRAAVALVSESESEEPAEAEDSGAPAPREDSEPAEREVRRHHGGSLARFHEGCELPAAAALDGNWTHGDYVSANAHGSDREAHLAAAHSACGKPMKSLEKNHKDRKDGKGQKHGNGHGRAGKHGKSKHHNG
jgi:hypothetical protein